jgi:DNA-binding XRE family transcriptional regulator
MSLATPKEPAATNEHMETVANLSIEQQLQLAAANVGGTLESKLTAAAMATIVARMVSLDEADQADLFACIKDLSTIKGREDAEDTMKTILEILEPRTEEMPLIDGRVLDDENPRQAHDSWLIWISQKLKALREERDLTQTQLADLAGLPQSHISRLEAGRHSPSMKTLKKLADALKVEIGSLNLLA